MNKASVFACAITRVFLLALGVVVTLAACSGGGGGGGSASPSSVTGSNPPPTRVVPVTPPSPPSPPAVDTGKTRERIIADFVGTAFGRTADDSVNAAPGDLMTAQQILKDQGATTPGALVATMPSQMEYITQTALHQVGSVYAYARRTGKVRRPAGGLTGFAVVEWQPNLGKGSHINIISGLGTGSFAPRDSVDLEYPEFDEDINLRFIDPDVVGDNSDNGLGEGVIALINGLRDGDRTMGIAPDATVSIRGAAAGDVVDVLKESQSAGNARRGNVIVIDRTLAVDATSRMDTLTGALGQLFSDSDGHFDNDDANKLSTYVTRLERGRFTVPTSGTLGTLGTFGVRVDSKNYASGTSSPLNAGTYQIRTKGTYRLPAGAVG